MAIFPFTRSVYNVAGAYLLFSFGTNLPVKNSPISLGCMASMVQVWFPLDVYMVWPVILGLHFDPCSIDSQYTSGEPHTSGVVDVDVGCVCMLAWLLVRSGHLPERFRLNVRSETIMQWRHVSLHHTCGSQSRLYTATFLHDKLGVKTIQAEQGIKI